MRGSELVNSIFRVFVYAGLCMTVIFIVLSFVYRENTVNSYTEECNEVISRTGGVTHGTENELDNLSQSNYHNLFSVSPESGQYAHQQRFGAPIHYKLNTNIPFINHGLLGLPRKVLHYSSPETVASNIRSNSQHYTD